MTKNFPIPDTVTPYLKQFSGRGWLLPIILDWFEQGSEQTLLLTGGPGTGKSMIMGWLASGSEAAATEPIRRQLFDLLSCAHFCRANDRSSFTPLAFADNMANQLTQNIIGFDEALMRALEPYGIKLEINQTIGHVEAGATVTGLEIKNVNLAGLTDTDSFDISFMQPLRELYKNGYDQPMLILVDSMDEAWSGNERGQELVKALGELAGLPPQVKLLITSRPDPRLLKHFQQARHFDLVTDAPNDVTDILDFSYNWLSQKRQLPESQARWLAGCIDEAAAGIFLYAYMVLSDVIDHRPAPEYSDAFELPRGMSGIYHEFLTRELGDDEDRWYEELQPLLGLIAVAQGDGVIRAKLKTLLVHNPTQNLRICHQYLSGELNDGPFRLFHKSLADFLLDDPENLDYEIDAAEMHQRFAALYQPGVDFAQLDEYDLRYLADHLAGAGRLDNLEKLLLDFNYLQAKLNQTDIKDLLDDFDYLQVSKRNAPVRLVQGALQLSADVLAMDKTQLAGQLLERLLGFEQSELRPLLAQAKAWRGATWLRPLKGALTPPGGALIATLSGHAGNIFSLALSPDGQRLVSASNDCTVKIWDMVNGQLLYSLVGHNDAVNKVLITPDGQKVISAARDGLLGVWSITDGQVVHVLGGHQGAIHDVAVSPDGQWIVSASEDTFLAIWELASGELRFVLEGHTAGIGRVQISADGRWVVSASWDGRVLVWDAASGQLLKTLTEHTDSVFDLALSPDNQHLVSASKDKTLKIWALPSGQLLHTLTGHAEAVNKVALTPDGQQVISASWDGTLRIWEVASGQLLHTLSGHAHALNGMALSADGRFAVSASQDKTLKVWDVATAQLIATFVGHSGGVGQVVISADGQRVVSGAQDMMVKVWDAAAGQTWPTLSWHNDRVTAVALSADGRRAVSGSKDYTLKIWDVETGQALHSCEGHLERVTDVVITPDGRRVISGSRDNTLKIWDGENGELLHTLSGHTQWVTALAISPDGRWVASGSEDGLLKIWDVANGRIIHTLTERPSYIRDVAISPDGRWVVSGSISGVVEAWDMTSGELLYTREGHADWMRTVAFSLDGKILASAAGDGSLKIWEAATGQLLHSLVGHPGEEIRDIALSPNGQRVVSASWDETLIIWDVVSGEPLHTLEGHVYHVERVVITPDGRYVISGSKDGMLKIWDIESGEMIGTFNGEAPVFSLIMGSQGTVVMGDEFGRVHFFELVRDDSGR
ncbi:MAG: hypothetical protein KDE51_10915 [Anaerolineales bacterium]|nr:hypothetical protein [Anaerolineales bacterium]